MGKRGRPRKEGVRHVFRVTLTLWEGEDDDLIDFFLGLSPRQYASAIKQALRAGGILLTDPEEDDEDFDLDDFLV